MQTLTVPYGIQLRYDPRKGTLTPTQIDILARELDELVRSEFIARRSKTEDDYAGHFAKSAENTTTEVIPVHNVDVRPRLELHVTHAHVNGWDSTLHELEGEIKKKVHDFLTARGLPPGNPQRPRLVVRWSDTTDKWYISDPPLAPS